MESFGKRRVIQKLLGCTLPESATDLHYFRWQPSPDLSYYIAYIKCHLSKDEFSDLSRQMMMDFHNTGGAALLYLPTSWKIVPELTLEWWDPDQNTPAEAAAKSFGSNGWIVAKYERDYIYVIVTDTGYSGAI